MVEAVADRPGAGVTALARELSVDKMAGQRILAILAEAGWIRNADGEAGRRELAPSLARLGRGGAVPVVQYGETPTATITVVGPPQPAH